MNAIRSPISVHLSFATAPDVTTEEEKACDARWSGLFENFPHAIFPVDLQEIR
jgi:hypothetical protein